MFRLTIPAVGILAVIATSAAAQSVSPNGVKTLSPVGAIKPTGTWDLATRAGDFIYIAGIIRRARSWRCIVSTKTTFLEVEGTFYAPAQKKANSP